MYSFQTMLKLVNNTIYVPSNLVIDNSEEELQNSEYGAGLFTLSFGSTTKKVRFRVAKITPNKVGQFVTFWEKDNNGVNQAYHYDEAPDLLIVTVLKTDTLKSNNGDFRNINFGQFIFPKIVLLEQGILRSDFTKGKMGIRVYPSWDHPKSTTAQKTQQWQLEYFFESINLKKPPLKKLLDLHQIKI